MNLPRRVLQTFLDLLDDGRLVLNNEDVGGVENRFGLRGSFRKIGLHQRMRMVSGPQGPRVVLDGRPAPTVPAGAQIGGQR